MLPPIAPRRPHVHTEHDVERPDPYFWLKERGSEDVLDYVKAENAFMEAQTASLKPVAETLYAEMRGRIQETDRSAPVHYGGFYYYHRTEEGLSYKIHCRSTDEAGEHEEVLLDENELAKGHDFFQLADLTVSPDHTKIAFSTDVKGDEKFVIQVKDLDSGEILADRIPDVGRGIAWANDSRTFFWLALDAAHRAWRVHRHVLGESGDPVVFQEDDDRFMLAVWRTRSRRFVVIGAFNAISTELHLMDADSPEQAPHCLAPREPEHKYTIAHVGEALYIRTDDCVGEDGEQTKDCVNYKIMKAPLRSTSKAEWVEVVPHRTDVELSSVDAWQNHLVLTERSGGITRFRVIELSSGDEHYVEMPQPTGYVAEMVWSPRFDSADLRFRYSTLTTPGSTMLWDMENRALRTLKRDPVPTYDESEFVSERIEATAADGTKIPMSVVRRADLDMSKPQPTLLYGYGAYGLTVEPEFSSQRMSMVGRGVVFVIAHIRGGGFLGRPWYEDGKYERKTNSFTDFVSCAEHLISLGWSEPERLAIAGGSAGGLLMGAVINLAPHLFRACLASVPFVDVVSTMLDADLPLTAGEWDEWGDPRTKHYFDVMCSYAPYENVTDVTYPDLLVISGLNDPRVQYWEPTKWVARLRHRSPQSDVLLKTHMGAGHAGKSGRYGYLEDRAFEASWLLDRLGC